MFLSCLILPHGLAPVKAERLRPRCPAWRARPPAAASPNRDLPWHCLSLLGSVRHAAFGSGSHTCACERVCVRDRVGRSLGSWGRRMLFSPAVMNVEVLFSPQMDKTLESSTFLRPSVASGFEPAMGDISLRLITLTRTHRTRSVSTFWKVFDPFLSSTE